MLLPTAARPLLAEGAVLPNGATGRARRSAATRDARTVVHRTDVAHRPLLPADGDEILFKGRDVVHMTENDLIEVRRKIACLFQVLGAEPFRGAASRVGGEDDRSGAPPCGARRQVGSRLGVARPSRRSRWAWA